MHVENVPVDFDYHDYTVLCTSVRSISTEYYVDIRQTAHTLYLHNNSALMHHCDLDAPQ